MDQLIQWIQTEWGLSPELQSKIFTTIVTILIMAILYRFIRRILYRTIDNSKTYYKTKKIVSYIFIGIAFLMVVEYGLEGYNFLLTF